MQLAVERPAETQSGVVLQAGGTPVLFTQTLVPVGALQENPLGHDEDVAAPESAVPDASCSTPASATGTAEASLHSHEVNLPSLRHIRVPSPPPEHAHKNFTPGAVQGRWVVA